MSNLGVIKLQNKSFDIEDPVWSKVYLADWLGDFSKVLDLHG